MNPSEIIAWLKETDEVRLAALWQRADRTRQEHVGGEVHLRGLIELSNHCVRLCGYCGIRAGNRAIQRYRMSHDEAMTCAEKAVELGYGTVVLQSGEDPELTTRWVAELVSRIKHQTPLAVTLSLGERDEDELLAWRDAGADRYLLRFETSNRRLYERIHPPRPGRPSDRLAILRTLGRLGYEVGSGVMIGIPGQTYDDLARDIELFGALDLDMIGVGPYVAHPATPLADPAEQPPIDRGEQVPATALMTYTVIALARLMCPGANIASTTALGTVDPVEGRELGLVRGANVLMPNLTPPEYRRLYEIYPGKICVGQPADAHDACLRARIAALGREIGAGRGDSLNYAARNQPADRLGVD
jgi:biotin synthase